MSKQNKRCPWPGVKNQAYIEYHDKEWGVPVYDDQTHFEFMVLESAQAGLSWETVLNKRSGYAKAFVDFEPTKVARFTQRKVELLVNNPAIIRNRMKIEAAINNAQQFLKVQEEFDGFYRYIWQFVDGAPMQNRWRSLQQMPATSEASDALSKDLKKRGFKFFGSTIAYAHMQATGLVNDHLIDCFRYRVCQQMAK
ncbi:MAG: DNA-3-methyladenine glycosylase I [Gammaproteobacteria bacterium]|nr:DNA-3-methyladenine glycosylase I [Gammaproteobacteria bacterium]